MLKFILMIIVLVNTSVVSAQDLTEQQMENELSDSYVLHLTPSPTETGVILFECMNLSDSVVYITPAGTNYSRIVIHTPEEQRIEFYSWEKFIEEDKVQPNETYLTTANIFSVFDILKIRKDGKYRVSWELSRTPSDKKSSNTLSIVVNSSNNEQPQYLVLVDSDSGTNNSKRTKDVQKSTKLDYPIEMSGEVDNKSHLHQVHIDNCSNWWWVLIFSAMISLFLMWKRKK